MTLHVITHRLGSTGVLVEVDGLEEVLCLATILAERHHAGDGPWARVSDVVPAARTVLVRGTEEIDAAALEADIAAVANTAEVQQRRERESEVVEVPVRYDGPDLDEIASHTGLSVNEVKAAHGASEWTVAFCGFAPGFPYLVGGDPRLRVPRRDTPRTKVPRGAVGLAGEFSGVYPRESPGGWQLLGTTGLRMWDESRDPPALLQPGTRVRFVEDGEPQKASERANSDPRAHTGEVRRGMEILAVGPLVTVQDAGRPGQMNVGVGHAGAADRGAWRLANRLLGQGESTAASLEVVYGGLRLRARGMLTLCLTGAPAPARIDGKAVGHNAVLHLEDGQELTLEPPPVGLRTYVGVRGGVLVDAVLGSRSHDSMAGLGPAPLQPGDVLAVAESDDAFPHVDAVAEPRGRGGANVELQVTRGPRYDWFEDPGQLASAWTVSARSDRVGLRLEGTPLQRDASHEGAELASEGTVRGCIQVPPNGQPVIFLNDHPVTGGYPVIGVLPDAEVDRAAQLRPGDVVNLRWRA